MSQTIDVNGQSINYPETGDTNWGDEATDFAVQTSAALGKLGLASGTTVDIPSTLDVTGATTLDSTLTVAGTTTLNGTANLNGNTNLGNAITDTIKVTGIVNVDSGVLYVDPTNSRVGINDTTPSEALDVIGNALISGTLGVTGNSTLTGNLSVNGNTTLGDASGDSLTINSNGVSIPNGLNFDTNTLVIDAANNRVGINTNTPGSPLDIVGASGITSFTGTNRLGVVVRGSTSTNDYSGIDFIGANSSHPLGRIALRSTGGGSELSFGTSNTYASGVTNEALRISFNGQLSAVVPGGSTLYPGYLCRAWVNFNGTGTVAIRASGNVSSITDNGTGDYTVNFTTALPDENYSAIMTCSISGNTINIACINGVNRLYSVSQIRLTTGQASAIDADIVNIGIFR